MTTSDFDGFEDLDDDLRTLGEAVPVGAGDPRQPQRRARRRTNTVRAVAGSSLLAAGVLGGLALTQESSPSVQVTATEVGPSVVVAAGEGTVRFTQRSVEGVVNYADSSFVSADGVLYMLSTAPGSTFPEHNDGYQPTRALYSTVDGETWNIVDLGEHRISGLSERNGLLYAISTTEGQSGAVSHALASSSDGGESWDLAEFEIGLELPNGPGFASKDPYVYVDLEITDTAFLASVSAFYEADYEWIYQELGLNDQDGLEPEFTDDGVIIRDFSQCWGEASATVATTIVDGCDEPPVISETSYAELGIEIPLNQVQSQFGLRSLDGETWDRVDLPGDILSIAGDNFVATLWTETGSQSHVSADGLTWAAGEPNAIWRTIASASLGGQLASFRFEEQSEDSETSGRLLFGRSLDGTNWQEVEILEADDRSSAWPVFQDVGPLGAVSVLQTYDLDSSTTGHTILYSVDGVSWQALEVADPPQGEVTAAFMTADSIGVTFSARSGSTNGVGELTTVLLTPER